jgi:hypothetical protein
VSQSLHDPSATHLRTLLARGGSSALEAFGAEAAPVRPDDIVGRVEEIFSRMPAEDVGDPREFRRALDKMLRATSRAARVLTTARPLSPGDLSALEAVVITDGTRPTLLLRDDSFDPQHPLAGTWTDSLAAVQTDIGEIAKAVGRIEPDNATARSFFGTGWVIDTERGLVLSNLHVLEQIWRSLPDVVVRAGSGYRILDGVYIDFVREATRTRTSRFRIVEATPSGIDGANYARLDAAVLRIEPTEEGQVVPKAIPVKPDPDGPVGNLEAIYVLGFPGPPSSTTGRDREGVDWAQIYRVLFGNLFGVKRLAPGTVHRPVGSMNGDTHHWVFGHDATTLGGCSGSPTVALVDGVLSAFGLHFAGTTESTNYAHAFSAGATELAAIGVPLGAPN